MKEKILSIASDLREGSMSLDKAKELLLKLLTDKACSCAMCEGRFKNTIEINICTECYGLMVGDNICQ